MTYRTITLNIPDGLYQRLAQRGGATNRTLEEQILKTLSSGLFVEEGELPPEFAAIIAELEASDDSELLQIAATPNSPRLEVALQDMRSRLKSPDISLDEKYKLEEILFQYDLKERVRSTAADRLKRLDDNVH